MDVLKCVHRETELNGWPPTMREIGDELDMASTNQVKEHLTALEEAGLIWRAPHKARAVTLTKAGMRALGLEAKCPS